MSASLPHVTAIVPTLCESSRETSLRSALRSLLSQEGAHVVPLVVVNGNRYDEQLLSELKETSGVRVLYQEEGSLPLALRTGRQAVDTPFFCFLDDDDVYLEGAIQAMLVPMLADDGIDLCVGNGIKVVDQVDRVVIEDIELVRSDPSGSVLTAGWLCSCSGLYRTRAIPPDFFDDSVPYLEWTALAVRLSLTKRVAFIDRCTYRYNETDQSLSKTAGIQLEYLKQFDRMLTWRLPRRLRREIGRKRAALLHDLAEKSRSDGDLVRAWSYHLRSLRSWFGLRLYSAYTRRLIFAVTRRADRSVR